LFVLRCVSIASFLLFLALSATLFLFHKLPSPATPVSGGSFVFCRSTLVSGTKRLAASGVALFDGHVGVAKTNNLSLATLTLDIDRRFLRPIRSSKGSVKCYFPTFVCSHYFCLVLLLSLYPSDCLGFSYLGMPKSLVNLSINSLLGFAIGFDGLLVGFFI
jgi:hypothetical protein